jgi:hypothetical protein
MKISGTRRGKSGLPTNLSDLIDANDLQLVDGVAPGQRRRATRNPFSPIVLIVTILATLGVLAYGAFLLNPSARGDLLPWIIVIVAETVLVFHALMAVWTMLVGYGRRPPFSFFEAQAKLYDVKLNWRLGLADRPERWPVFLDGAQVNVAVFVTVYGEPLEVIRRTAVAARDVHGRHTTYLLDDGNSDDVRALAAELGCRYIRRLSNSGAKAGNINNALTVAKLFTVSSPSLLEAYTKGFRPPSTAAYDLSAKAGTVTYKAVTAGSVADLTATPGTYVADGASLASIVANKSRTVEAVYTLTPFDYGRIEQGASVQILLPDNSSIDGRVSGVSVTTDNGRAVTRVVVESAELMSPQRETLTRRGTPVVAVLHLRDDGILSGPTDAFLHFLTKIGLR